MKKLLIIAIICSASSLFAQNYDDKKMESAATEKLAKQGEPLKNKGIDPVCKMKVKKGSTITHVHNGIQYGFCNEYCREVFLENPKKYAKQ